jgi:hypothetical protein
VSLPDFEFDIVAAMRAEYDGLTRRNWRSSRPRPEVVRRPDGRRAGREARLHGFCTTSSSPGCSVRRRTFLPEPRPRARSS